MEEELERALSDAGVSRAQLGTDGVSYSVEGEEITLYLGDAEEVVCETVEDAIERIQAHAEETEADPEIRGAIAELASWLGELVRDEDDTHAAATGLIHGLLEEAARLELIHHEKLSYTGPSGQDVVFTPEGNELAFFEDANGLYWTILVTDTGAISYREIELEG
jgi:hypothetical protein